MKREAAIIADHLSRSRCCSIDVLRSRGLEPADSRRERRCTQKDIQWIILDEQNEMVLQQQQESIEEGASRMGLPREEECGDSFDVRKRVECSYYQEEELSILASSLTLNNVKEARKRGFILQQEILHGFNTDVDKAEGESRLYRSSVTTRKESFVEGVHPIISKFAGRNDCSSSSVSTTLLPLQQSKTSTATVIRNGTASDCMYVL